MVRLRRPQGWFFKLMFQNKTPTGGMARGGDLRSADANYELVREYHQQADARMARIDQVILAIDVVDVDVIVVVIPVRWPRLGVLEIMAAVIKAAIFAAARVEMMLASETCAELRVRDTPAATALISVATVAVLFGLLRTLLILRTILLLCGPGLVITIALVLLFGAIALPIALVLLGSVILLRSVILVRPVVLLGAVVLLRSIILLRAVLLRPIVLSRLIILPRSIVLLRGLGAILILLLPVRFLFRAIRRFFLVLAASVGLLSLFWLFLLSRFFLRFIFIGLLPRVAGGADKEHHHRCTKDELRFDSSIS